MKKRLLVLGIVVAATVGGVVVFGSRTNTIEHQPNQEDLSLAQEPFRFEEGFGTLTQAPCEHPFRRPLAVMMSSDAEVRPLSGIASADVVIEMPVVTGLITRMMAVFQCEDVEEIGSVRSARHDFIPLSAFLDALFAHWGGSILSLQDLEAGVVDNIDAMVNIGRAYWEKSGIARPHAGFTSTDRLLRSAEQLGYRTETNVLPFVMQPSDDRGEEGTIIVGYPGDFIVSFEYDPASRRYYRFRDGTPEIDKNTGKQVAVSNVVVMRAESRQVLDDYNDVTLEGEGEVFVYRNGKELPGTWVRRASPIDTPLLFLNNDRTEIKLQPGRTWISIVEPGQSIEWIITPKES